LGGMLGNDLHLLVVVLTVNVAAEKVV
jgi:hypothetical protein